jgi:hypothetical protein
MPLDPATLTAIAMNVVLGLEQVTGMPMVVIQRSDDPLQVWKNTQSAFCTKTNGAVCDLRQMEYMTETQNFAGFSNVVSYKSSKDGRTGKLCVIMPPDKRFATSHAAMAMSGGKYFSPSDQPSKGELDAFLIMHNAAECLSDSANSPASGARADAFAALALTLIEGDPSFTRSPNTTPARKFAFMRYGNTTGAAVNVGERILLDTWKVEAVAAIRQSGCQVTAEGSSGSNTPAIPRDGRLPLCTTYDDGMSGASGGATGMMATGGQRIEIKHPVTVSDKNLHLWMYGETGRTYGFLESANPIVGAPPQPWRPFKTFASTKDAVSYMWNVSRQVTGY